jgi:hypothetical protein
MYRPTQPAEIPGKITEKSAISIKSWDFTSDSGKLFLATAGKTGLRRGR